MNSPQRYTDDELKEIASFLRGSYVQVAGRIVSARRRDPGSAVEPELERLRNLGSSPKEGATRISDGDIEELADALEGPFASDLPSLKETALKPLKDEAKSLPGTGSADRRSMAIILLKNVSRVLCSERKSLNINTLTISTASLTFLMQHLQLDPLFAPVVVWLARLIRDAGLPVFCGSLKDYLASRGI